MISMVHGSSNVKAQTEKKQIPRRNKYREETSTKKKQEPRRNKYREERSTEKKEAQIVSRSILPIYHRT